MAPVVDAGVPLQGCFMMRRQPAVAGMFYTDDGDKLGAEIRDHLAGAATPDPLAPCPKALIGPHAGTRFSGPIAASAYARVVAMRDTIERVVLLGPSHHVAFRGLAASSAKFFTTPLGDIPLDRELIDRLLAFPQVQVLDEAHRREHSLELHLPFLQEVMSHFQLVPLVVGEAEPSSVAEVIEAAWGGPETLIVVSTDLSHFHDYDTCCSIDRETSEHIAALRFEQLSGDRACGFVPLRGLLLAARRRAMAVEIVDVRNSGDTDGPRDRVVGYGAYLLHATPPS
jgi:AmmeMemoRadiSam system protein B